MWECTSSSISTVCRTYSHFSKNTRLLLQFPSFPTNLLQTLISIIIFFYYKRSLSILTLLMLWPCSKVSKVLFESIKINICKHQNQQAIKFDVLHTLFFEKILTFHSSYVSTRIRKQCFPCPFQIDLTPKIFPHRL